MIPLLLALVAAAAEPAVLDDDAYRFCHVPGADAAIARDWCDLLAEVPPERCPALRETCAGVERDEVDPREMWEDLKAGCAGGSADERALAAPPEAPSSEPVACQPPESQEGCSPAATAAMGGAVARWLAAIAVGVVLLVLLRMLARWFGGFEPGMDVEAEPIAATALEVPDADAVPDLPSGDLLAAARQALAEGRAGDAVLFARSAALRALAEAGRIRLHRARTDREYVRQLRREPALQEPLRRVVGVVEGLRWGGRAPDRSLAGELISGVERLVRSAAPLLLLWAALPSDAEAARRYGPYGDAALEQVVEGGGLEVGWRLRPLAQVDDAVDVLIVDLPGTGATEEDEAALRRWVEAGGVLVLAGPPTGFPELGEPVGVANVGRLDLDPVLAPAGLAAPVLPPGPSWGFRDPTGEVWAWTEDAAGTRLAAVEVVWLGAGAVIAVADERLFRNAAFVHPDNEAFVRRLLPAAVAWGAILLPDEARIELATRAGAARSDPLGVLASARLLPLVAQLLLFLAVAALWRGWPFGPLRDPPGEGRRSFVEHLRAVAAHQQRLGATRWALAAYARLWLSRLGPAGLVLAGRRAGLDAEAAERLARRAEEAAGDPDGPDHPDDMQTVEDLWRITRRR